MGHRVSNLLSGAGSCLAHREGGREERELELKPFGLGAEIAFAGLATKLLVITFVNLSSESKGKPASSVLAVLWRQVAGQGWASSCPQATSGSPSPSPGDPRVSSAFQ